MTKHEKMVKIMMCGDKWEPIPVLVNGYVFDEYPGLAITEVCSESKYPVTAGRYTITHLSSGYSIIPRMFWNIRDGIEMLKILCATGFDWSMSKEDMRKNYARWIHLVDLANDYIFNYSVPYAPKIQGSNRYMDVT